MPVYEYECRKCGHVFELRQSFGAEPIKTCPKDDCDGRVRKILSPPALVFKGSGFHVNDYDHHGRKSTASKAKSTSPAKADTAESSSSEVSESKEQVEAETSS